MNDVKRTATLSWLMERGRLGELPDHLDEECREFAESFISAALSNVTKARDPEKLGGVAIDIALGEVEGEYRGSD